MAKKLSTLAYTSQCLIPKSEFKDEINSIIDVAHAYNEKCGITGVLFFSNGRFLQILEGEMPELEQLMQSIAHDPRHNDLQYIVEKPIVKRGFESWVMAFYDLDDASTFSAEAFQDIRTALLDQDILYSAQDVLGLCHSAVDDSRHAL